MRVWDAESGEEVSVLKGHEDEVTSVCSFVSAEGGVRIVSGSQDDTVRVWDVASQGAAGVLLGNRGDAKCGDVNCVCLLDSHGRDMGPGG